MFQDKKAPATKPSSPKTGDLRAPELDKQYLDKRFQNTLNLIESLCKIAMEGLGGTPPGKLSGAKRVLSQVKQDEHCGMRAENFLELIEKQFRNIVSPETFTLNLEVIGQSLRLDSCNHARILIGSPRGVYVADPWAGELRFVQADKNGKVMIPNLVNGEKYYKVDKTSGKVTPLNVGTGKDKIHIETRAQTKDLPFKPKPGKKG